MVSRSRAVAGTMTRRDVGNGPAAGVAREPQPQQRDLRRRQADFALARLRLQPLDGANRAGD